VRKVERSYHRNIVLDLHDGPALDESLQASFYGTEPIEQGPRVLVEGRPVLGRRQLPRRRGNRRDGPRIASDHPSRLLE
jgi:hypothetical protein